MDFFKGRDATPYLERNRVEGDAIDAASALTDMGKYLFLERRLPVYDIAVAITKLDMCRFFKQFFGFISYIFCTEEKLAMEIVIVELLVLHTLEALV